MDHHPDNIHVPGCQCEYKVIGGRTTHLARTPSTLALSERQARSQGRVPSPNFLRPRENGEDTRSSSSAGNSSLSNGIGGHILKWDQDDVLAWLKECGFEQYEIYFKKHAITGQSLVVLEEKHLKEMDIFMVGHRLELMKCIEDLRKEVGLVSRDKYEDIDGLRMRLKALDVEKMLRLYPRRIILIRHGESEGNVDTSLYAVKPDRKMELTPKGIKQACAAGIALKQLVEEESVSFYVSPFTRSRQTYEHIRKAFHSDQVVAVREDPRIREQEWGNFQDPSMVNEVMEERRKVGAFFYRFLTGESGADVYDRVSTFLETLYRDMEKGGCGDNAIMISHGLFCRFFLMRFFHWKVEKFHKLWNFENCQYAIMELQPGGNYRLVSELKSDP